jgi:hypothetical protein
LSLPFVPLQPKLVCVSYTMKSFYSILQLVFNQGAGEHLALGLLLVEADGQIYFRISEERHEAIRLLLSEESKRLLNDSLKDLSLHFQDAEVSIQTSLNLSPSLFRNQSYLQYLSRYQNNLLRFSNPVAIEAPANPDVFQALYWRYVHAGADNESPRLILPSPFEILKTEFYPRIQNRVNTDYQITSEILPTLFLNTQVNLIGKNEKIVVGKEVQFRKRAYNLGKDLNDIYALIKSFEANDQPGGKYFLIGNEPPKSEIKQHEMWSTMHRSKWVDLVSTSETEKIESYLADHDVQPLEPANVE